MTNAIRRALIVIDVQNEYVTGALPIEYPPVDQSLNQIGRAIDAANASGVPVVLVQNLAPADSPLFARGSDGARLHKRVAQRDHDYLIEKSLPSAFANTDLADWLARRQINTLTIVGYMTHNCDDATIKQALHSGFAVEFLSDAAGSLSYRNSAGAASAQEIHRVMCVVLQSRFAAVLSADQWIACLKSGTAPLRETILDSYRQAHP